MDNKLLSKYKDKISDLQRQPVLEVNETKVPSFTDRNFKSFTYRGLVVPTNNHDDLQGVLQLVKKYENEFHGGKVG